MLHTPLSVFVDMRMGHCYSTFTDNEKCGGARLTTVMLMKQFCCCTAPEGSAWEEAESKVCEACPSMTSGEILTNQVVLRSKNTGGSIRSLMQEIS